uniref:Uncharacterized protein n=1 Tax=Glossina pallidipes TaxID=7398 RepID=A0A1B0AJY2_GLOPL
MISILSTKIPLGSFCIRFALFNSARFLPCFTTNDNQDLFANKQRKHFTASDDEEKMTMGSNFNMIAYHQTTSLFMYSGCVMHAPKNKSQSNSNNNILISNR